MISQRFNCPAQPVEESEELGPPRRPILSLSQRFGELMVSQRGVVGVKRKSEQEEAACDVRKKIMERLSGKRQNKVMVNQCQAGPKELLDSQVVGDSVRQDGLGEMVDSQEGGVDQRPAGLGVIIDSHGVGDGPSQTDEGREERIAKRKARFGVVDQNFFDNEKYLVDRKPRRAGQSGLK